MSGGVRLAAVRKTVMLRRWRDGGVECWGAETLDGTWVFEREESPGTPWLVWHKPSVTSGFYTLPVMLCGTLRACRAYVAAGHGDAQLARLRAHQGGEHAGQRDPACRAC